MKPILTIFTIAVMAVTAVACTNKKSQTNTQNEDILPENTKPNFRDSISGRFVTDYESWDTIGYVAGHFVCPEQIDTLFCIALGTHHYSDVEDVAYGDNFFDTYVFTNEGTNIPPLYLSEFYWVNNVKTHDLDLDGLDEIGMVHGWWIGCWTSYNVFDLENGAWTVYPATGYYVCQGEIDTIATPSTSKDYYYVWEDVWDNEIEDLAHKQIRVQIQRIPYLDDIHDTCYTLPNGTPITLPLK